MKRARWVLGCGLVLLHCSSSSTGGTPTPDAGAAAPVRPLPSLAACVADRACVTPLVVAHRGEGGTAPENSVAAALEAWTLGADVVEVDVRRTLDNALVLLHDSTLERTTNQVDLFAGTPAVGELTLAQVLTLTLKDPGNVCTPQNADANAARCRVPMLAALLRAARGRVLVMLDYKDGDVTQVADTVVAEDALDTAFFFDANETNLDAAAARGMLTMPRADDAASTRDLMARRNPFVVHVDPGYLAEVSVDARAAGVKLFVNLFVTVDFNLVAYSLTGDLQSRDDAETALRLTLDSGAGLMQTDRAPEVRALVDAWLSE
jgi:hypothetical protein